MRKSVKIIIIIGSILVLILAYFGYKGYQSVMEGAALSGKNENIPLEFDKLSPLSIGNADWPNWRGLNLDGKSEIKGINKDWSKGLKKLWQIDYLCQDRATATWSAPVIQGNRLIVQGRDEMNDLVFCLNSETGALIWKGSYDASAGRSHGSGARATPFIDSNMVYTYGRGGDLVCWNMEDGKLIWRKNVKNFGGQEPTWGFSSSPFVYENKVIIQGGGDALVLAFHKTNGELIWKSMEGEAGYSFAMPINIESKNRLLIYHGIGLSCLDFDNGNEFWQIPWKTEYCVNATTPIVFQDIIFHTSGYGMGGQAIKVTNEGFSVLWKNESIEAQHSDPVLIDGYLYGFAGNSSRNVGHLRCVELKTGNEMWSTDQVGWGTMIYVDNTLICLDIKGNLFLVNPDPSFFQKIGEIKLAIKDVKNPAWTVPVAANGKLYLRYLQHLVCYDLMP